MMAEKQRFNNNNTNDNSKNNNNNNNNSASQAMFPTIDAATGLSILTQQQLLAQAALISSIPVSLHATLATPSLYSPHIFNGWAPQPASSPPDSLRHSPGSAPTVTSTRSATRRNGSTSTSKNNNNMTSSVVNGERRSKKRQSLKRKYSKMKADSAQPALENGASVSPPVANAEAAKDTSKEKTFTCGVCNRSFGYKHVLQNHERTHTGEKPFECRECHKKFTRDHHLKTHMRLHTGEKPYWCMHCERKFVQVANLRRHLRVHTGERPYSCEVCSSRFSDSNQLKAHQLIHKGEKPFECGQCHTRFRRRHHLINHKCDPALAAQLESQIDSPQVINNHENGIEEEVDIDDEEELENTYAMQKIIAPITGPHPHQASTSAGTSRLMPLNLPAIPANLPEQTEPEDLSMSTGMHKSPNSNGESSITVSTNGDGLRHEDVGERNVSETNQYPRPRVKYTRQHPKGAFPKTRDRS